MNEWYQNKADKVSAVWSKLAGLYGNRFTREFGDTAPEEWENIISVLQDHELSRGFRKLLAKGSGSAPTLPQFYAACKYADEEESRPSATPDKLSLPRPEYMEPAWAHGQKCLFAYLWTHTVDNSALPKMIEAKNRLVCDFRNLLAEGEDVTGSEIRDAMFKAWDAALCKTASG